jgi:hypothetical protein
VFVREYEAGRLMREDPISAEELEAVFGPFRRRSDRLERRQRRRRRVVPPTLLLGQGLPVGCPARSWRENSQERLVSESAALVCRLPTSWGRPYTRAIAAMT